MFHLEEQGGEAKALGWISMTDMFMLCSIMMLVVAVVFAMSLKKSDLQLATVAGEYEQYRNTNTLTIEGMKEKSAQLSSEASGYKTQAAALDQQLGSLKVQLAESEKQRSHFLDESAKFKSQSEGLASDLSRQALKLNTVQNDFEKYRTVNTSTIGELNSDLARLTKEVGGYKTSAAALNLQITALESKLATSEKSSANLKAEGERLVAELANQKSKSEADLIRVNGELARLAAELNKTKDEQGNLLIDLNASKSAFAALQREDNELKARMRTLRGEKESAEAKSADLKGTIVGLTGEIGELKPQLTKLKMDLNGANLRIIDLEKAVFEKINRARLVVTVLAPDIPKGFTLELFVIDPLSNECGPFSPAIFNDGDEIGVLQQSVDFKSGVEGSQKAVFYSMRPIYSRLEPGGMYTVRAMIRHNNNDETARLPHAVTVTCSVDLPNLQGPDAHQVAKLEITSPGVIKKVRRSGALTPATPYKNMWPWEPVNHFERTVCDFRISGDRITHFRSFDTLVPESPYTIQTPAPAVRGPEEFKIDSIRNRSGN